jgi:hypothetical protein
MNSGILVEKLEEAYKTDHKSEKNILDVLERLMQADIE